MATFCLFAAAVIAVLSGSQIHGQYGRKQYIIVPVSNRHQNGGKIYWSLLPIERWNLREDRIRAEDDEEQIVNSDKHADYSGDRFTEDWNNGGRETHGSRCLETKSTFHQVDDSIRTWDGRENINELSNDHNEFSGGQNSRVKHRVRNIKNDYIQWRKIRDKLLHQTRDEGHQRNQNKQVQRLYDEIAEATVRRVVNGNLERNPFVRSNSLLDDTDFRKDNNGFAGDEMWQQQLGDEMWQQQLGDEMWQQQLGDEMWQQRLGDEMWQQKLGDEMWQQQLDDEYSQHQLRKVRKKRSPKLTKGKELKRQRRKKRRKEIRMQRKRMRIIKHDPEDEKFVPSVEEKKPTITYDYTTHEERPRNDLDEEFVSKMPRRGELGEFGEGSDEDSEEDENKAKEVTDDDDKIKKKKKKKDDGDKVKKGGDKPKGGKGGDRGKAKKGVSKKRIGKKERGKQKKKKKKKAAGRDTKAKHMLSDRNLHHLDTIKNGQHKSMDRPDAFAGNQPDIVPRQVQQHSMTHGRRNTIFNQIQRSAVGNGVDYLQQYPQNHVGSADILHTIANIKQTRQNKEDANVYEREKVLADFRKIFGQKNTVKLLMDKHQSHLNDGNENNNKASLNLAYSSVVNKMNNHKLINRK